MPFIEITMVEGRTLKQLRRMITDVTKAVQTSIDAPPETIRVVIREVPGTHFAAGDVTIAERAAATEPPPEGDNHS